MSYNPNDIDTSIVLIEQESGLKKKRIYIPGYFRIKVKNFTQMNLDTLNAQMNASLIFTVFYGDLDELSVKELRKEIVLLFARDDAIRLTEKNNLEIKIKPKNKQDEPNKKLIKFTIRKILNLKIDSEVFWSPFQIINLILTVTVQPVETKQSIIKINLMDTENSFHKMSYTQEGTFGNYDLAEKLMRAEYSNERDYKGLHKESGYWTTFKKFTQNLCKPKQTQGKQNDKDKDDEDKYKFKNFQYAHFNVPLYKFPAVALATIFLPLLLLAVINLGIFFQDNDLGGRIGSIAALMIAFVALIPTIRKQIPPNPRIVFVEILVYLQTVTSLFALIHSLIVRNDSEFNLVWYQSSLFLLSFLITILIFTITLVMMALHMFYWKNKYNLDLKDDEKKKQKKQQQGKFDRTKWKNGECDKQFREKSKLNSIKLRPYQKKIKP